MRIEFIEAGKTFNAEAIRFTKAEVDGKWMVCIGCRFERELDAGAIAAIVSQEVGVPELRRFGEPAKKSDTVVVVDPATKSPAAAAKEPARPGGLPLSPRGTAHTALDLLKVMVDHGASDLHIRGRSPARMRCHGELTRLTQRPVTTDEATRFIHELLSEEECRRFERERDLDLGYAAKGVGRFRINVFRAQGEVGMAIRRIPSEIPSIEDLQLSQVCKSIVEAQNGLVLVTGPTGSGKSSTLAAMIRRINETRACHIVTMEDPIEYVHTEQCAQITQREIGRDVNDFKAALRRAMRQDPDVLLVGEMRDLETIALAVTAAETGHLVFGTLHTTGAAATVERIIDVFPSGQQAQIRIQLANTLRAICSQVLLPRKSGGQVVAQEILVATPAIRALIREGKVPQIANVMQTSGKNGMQTLEEALNGLLAGGAIDVKTARLRANNPGQIQVFGMDSR
jgi:twitching motility protein PilT